MEEDPTLGEETGAQAESSAAHADARRIIFFMVRSWKPNGTYSKAAFYVRDVDGSGEAPGRGFQNLAEGWDWRTRYLPA
ncbi:MAG: hypothetical protein QHC88_17035 [Achromobacter sp.]|uniref:hypothetical protein n=1 Tax=Achromobacter sp. TaxID=134375 RepID=UPI0029A5E856|nr:hypothetical protein [Achromobacter sp.]MDX3986954.1 hypothetical protein [Achromobacter sp.]